MSASGGDTKPNQKIIYVIGSLDVGGAERHLADIAPALSKLGYRVAIYCLSARGAMAGAVASSGVEVIGPPLEGGSLASWGRIGWYLTFTLSATKFWLLLLLRRPAIVHCFLPMSNIIGVAFSRLSLIRLIVATRRSLNRYQSRSPFFGWIERKLNRCAHAVVSNSHAAKRELVNDEGISEERITVIHNGIPLSRVETSEERLKIREDLGIGPNALIFTIVANLIEYKGHLDLVAALASVSQRLPDQWLLLIVGRDDGIGAAVLHASRQSQIDKHIRMLGPRADIPRLLRASDIGVLCSHEEGFPNAVIEYMAAGLPVVATDVGGVNEAVSHGKNGILVAQRDPAALGAALLSLALDVSTRQTMGLAGRTIAAERFSFEACLTAYDRFYRRVLGVAPR